MCSGAAEVDIGRLWRFEYFETLRTPCHEVIHLVQHIAGHKTIMICPCLTKHHCGASHCEKYVFSSVTRIRNPFRVTHSSHNHRCHLVTELVAGQHMSMQVAEHDGAFSTYLLMLAIAETATGGTPFRSRCVSHCVCLSLPAFDCASVSLSDPHRVCLSRCLSASLYLSLELKTSRSILMLIL